MGAVYRAHDRTLGREVAVKVLHVDQVPPEGLERFQREAQALASLSHPNIVTIFDFGAADTSAWLVMELLLGPDVSTMVSQQGPLPMNAVLLLGQQLAAALTAAHDAGIVHRDIKPANVMLAGDGHFKLLDLGIARLVGATTATRSALTETGTILGSVPFLAPEVIGGQAAGPPADLYGLGGVLFTVLTGSPPFIGETTAATLTQHLHAPAPRVSATRPDVPAGLDHLVGRLLAKDPQDRPTAAESRTALAALLTDDPGPTVALARDTGATEVLDANQTRTLTGPPESATIDPVALPRRLRERPARLVQLTAAAMGLVVVVLLVLIGAGHTWGLGTWWNKLDIVRRYPILR